jgi:hypothetical protein
MALPIEGHDLGAKSTGGSRLGATGDMPPAAQCKTVGVLY